MSTQSAVSQVSSLAGQRAAHLSLALGQEQDHALILLEPDGSVSSWLAGSTRIFGYRSEEMCGSTLERLYTAEDVRHGDLRWSLAAAVTHGRVEDDRWHVRKDGVRIWTTGVTSALRKADGELAGFIKVLRDRTALHEHVETLKASLEEATHEGLREVIDRALGACAMTLAARSQTIAVAMAGTLTLRVNAARIQQALVNILSNSCKFSPPGARIWLEAHEVGGFAVISIEDHGRGIEPAVLPHVFNGEGLTVVKEIVNAHGGSVEARSEGLGKGTRLTMRLPMEAA